MVRSGRCLTGSAAILSDDATLLPEPDLVGRTARGGASAGTSFSRTRPRLQQFPSVKLLREAIRKVSRVRRPKDRWLLILRTLAMLALALAFLQPWLRSRLAGENNVAKTMVIAVDLSASMGYADGTRTRLAQASSAAKDLLATLPAGSQANVVWIQARSAGALPEPGPNLEFLRQALRQATVRPEPGDIAGAIGLALKQLGAAGGQLPDSDT